MDLYGLILSCFHRLLMDLVIGYYGNLYFLSLLPLSCSVPGIRHSLNVNLPIRLATAHFLTCQLRLSQPTQFSAAWDWSREPVLEILFGRADYMKSVEIWRHLSLAECICMFIIQWIIFQIIFVWYHYDQIHKLWTNWPILPSGNVFRYAIKQEAFFVSQLSWHILHPDASLFKQIVMGH